MSAIFGILQLADAPVNGQDVAALASMLATWSPNPAMTHTAESVTLGCYQLRTTPESLSETLPWQHPPSGLVITADARLDNRGELLSALGLMGQGRTVPDSELILHAFLRWRENCPQYLLGDFAFAIWSPATRELYCARDHLGGKPFSYARSKDYFSFASSPEALLILPWVSKKLEQGTLANLLVPAFDAVRENATWYADVNCIPPGHWLRLQFGGREELSRFWRPTLGVDSVFASDDAAREAFCEVLGKAVQDRMRSIDQPGILISGGMDSSAIAATVECHASRPSHTYSVISDKPDQCIESQCILALTQKDSFIPSYLRVPSITGLMNQEEIFNLAWQKPHPVDNDILLQSVLIQAAARNGQKVLLHGASGDLTLWSSRQYIANFLQRGQLRQAWHECRESSAHHTYYFGHPALKILMYNLYHAAAPRMLRTALGQLRSIGHDSKAHGFLNPDFADRLGFAQNFYRFRQERHRLSLRQAQDEDLLAQMVGLLSSMGGANRLGGRHGVEMRDPFGDRRMVEFFLRLPPKYKVKNGWTKYLVRTAFTDQLPDFVRFRRGKESLAREVHLAAMRHNPLFIDAAMSQSLPTLYDYLSKAHIHKVYQCHRKGDSVASRRLYDYISWARWLQRIATTPSVT